MLAPSRKLAQQVETVMRVLGRLPAGASALQSACRPRILLPFALQEQQI